MSWRGRIDQVTDLPGRGGNGFAKRAGANWFCIKWLGSWVLGGIDKSLPEGVAGDKRKSSCSAGVLHKAAHEHEKVVGAELQCRTTKNALPGEYSLKPFF
jgi:hypothetical protein